MLIIVIQINAQQNISLTNGIIEDTILQTAPIRNIQNLEDGIIVTYRFNNASISQDPLYPSASSICINGFGVTHKITKPAVSSRTDVFELPLNKKGNISILESHYIDIDIELPPARPYITTSDSILTAKDVPSIEPYTGLFPSTIISDINTQIYRGHTLLYVRISPIQYDYENKKARVYNYIQYKITYSDTIPIKSYLNTPKHISKNDNFLRNITLNNLSNEHLHRTIEDVHETTEDYLIISTPKYKDAVNKFARWKRILGFNVIVELYDTWTPDSIQNMVKKHYDSNEALYYLLIVGDHEDVPAKNNYTDLFYGCMDGPNDYLPDVYRGRLSVSTIEEAHVVIDKIIEYERTPCNDDNFYKGGLHCSYFQDENEDGIADTKFILTSEEILNYMLEQNYIDLERQYYAETFERILPQYMWYNVELPRILKPDLYPWDYKGESIVEQINNGYMYVLYHAHGSISSWANVWFWNSHVNRLNNGNKLPIVFCISCQNGHFDDETCIAESFIRKQNGGCVAIYAATRNIFQDLDDSMALGMFDAIFPNPGLNSSITNELLNHPPTATPVPTYRLGQIMDQGIARMKEVWGDEFNGMERTIQQYFHLFGDPSMRFPTQKPSEYDSVSVERYNGTITVNVISDSATISFYNRKTGEVTAYYSSNISNFCGDEDIVVCVSGHNKIPYIDEPAVNYVQNETISGQYTNVNNNILKIGENITIEKDKGEVVFNDGVSLLKGNRVELNGGVTIKKGAILEINPL